MYWRSDFAMELADCSDYSAEWAAHPEWHLRMDNGTVLQRGNYFYLDYTQPALRDFFARVLVNVSTAQLPPARAGSGGNAAGGAVLDYIFIDGDPDEGATQRYLPGIGPARSTAIVEGMYATFGDVQQQLEARGQGQSVVLNGCDTQWVRDVQVGSGAAASMFDHWSILQFVNKTDGSFALEAMDTAFRMATAPNASNASLHVKGWPGPIVGQRDVYPANLPQPKTPADFQREAAERFNSELALFLLVASARDFWTYSWFWSWDDYVPGAPDSTVPAGFFPQAKCAVGAPAGPYTPGPKGTWTYTREFANASVFVDLLNRTASHVEFKGSC